MTRGARTRALAGFVAVTAVVSLAASQPRTEAPPDALGAMRTWLRATAATHESDVATVDLQTRWPSHSPDPAGLDAALREALPAPTEGGRTHLELSARLEDGRVVLELTASATERSWFARFLGLRAAEERHRFEHALDAPLRRHVAALPALTESTVVQRAFLLPSRDYLALAVTDLGDDGPNELVLLRSDGVLEVFRLGSDGRGRTRIFPITEAPLPAAPRPGLGSPRPFGMLTPDEGSVLVALRDRDAIFRARLEGRSLVIEVVDDALCPPGAMPMADACAMPVDARDYFASQLLSRTGLPAPARAPTSFYARTRRRLHRADGSWGDVEAVVTPRGRLAVRTDARVVGVMGHGAALAMDDVDGDGQVELLASSDGAGPELLHVFRVRADGGLRALWRSEPLEGSVFVANAGDLDLDGSPELLAIEEPRDPGGRASLWVVR